MTEFHENTRYWLDQFNENANYSSGNTNPHDYSRWVRFVISAYVHGDDISEGDLRDVLSEAGWDQERAARMAREFRSCLRFIPEYEKYRPEHHE